MESYSVLMAVYHKENSDHFQQAIDSMLRQTYAPSEFVLVCDGPLTAQLDQVVDRYCAEYPELFKVVRLTSNQGLGPALNEGLAVCTNDLVARMDSDDISVPNRCQQQCDQFENDPELAVASGAVWEFQDTMDVVTGERTLPCSHEEICKFSRKRSPFNHPAVMFRKSAVQRAGGYRDAYPYLEDYDLWVRILKGGMKGANLSEPLVYMRAAKDMYKRRRGWRYAQYVHSFHADLKKSGWITTGDFLTGAIPHVILCILPGGITEVVYRALHK